MMYEVVGRVFNSNRLVGYNVQDMNGMVQAIPVDQFRDLVRQKMVNNCRISAGQVSGINGFQLKSLPTVITHKNGGKVITLATILMRNFLAEKDKYMLIGLLVQLENGRDKMVISANNIANYKDMVEASVLKMFKNRAGEILGCTRTTAFNVHRGSLDGLDHAVEIIGIQPKSFMDRTPVINPNIAPFMNTPEGQDIINTYYKMSNSRPLVGINELVWGDKGGIGEGLRVAYNIFNVGNASITVGDRTFAPREYTLLGKHSLTKELDRYLANAKVAMRCDGEMYLAIVEGKREIGRLDAGKDRQGNPVISPQYAADLSYLSPDIGSANERVRSMINRRQPARKIGAI